MNTRPIMNNNESKYSLSEVININKYKTIRELLCIPIWLQHLI